MTTLRNEDHDCCMSKSDLEHFTRAASSTDPMVYALLTRLRNGTL